MAYCYDHGIAHSEFLSWLPDDRQKAIAYQMEKALTCPSCGTASWQWDPAQGGDPHAFEAVAVRCEGCAAKDHEREVMRGGEKQPGVSVMLLPKAAVQRMVHTKRKRPKSRRELANEKRASGGTSSPRRSASIFSSTARTGPRAQDLPPNKPER